MAKTANETKETYACDDGDKLPSVSSPSLSKIYSYDAAGRTTGVTSGGITTTLNYDFESRLTSISRTGTVTNAFTYIGLDTRVGKVDSTGSTSFLRDGAYVTDPVIRDSNSAYTPGISERRGSATTFLHSRLKNADSQSSTSQTFSATRDYDAYGNVISSTCTWSGPFGYVGGFGYQEDGDNGLKLLGHRYYDSSTGRFLTRDPVKDGPNWYVYVSGSPVELIDPDGLMPLLWVPGLGELIGKAILENGGKCGDWPTGDEPPSGCGRPGTGTPPKDNGKNKPPSDKGKGKEDKKDKPKVTPTEKDGKPGVKVEVPVGSGKVTVEGKYDPKTGKVEASGSFSVPIDGNPRRWKPTWPWTWGFGF